MLMKVIIILLIVLFMLGYWVSLIGTVQIYTPELVPESGVTLCIFIKWFSAWIVTFLFPMVM
jgi:hypothetical protein